MKPIKRVLLVGGTHGNEWTGIYLVKKFERSPAWIQRSTFQCVPLLANPNAYVVGKRYVDTDLNRCFRQQDLQDPTLVSYEAQRAKEIHRTFGPEGSQPVDFVIDLHSTTSCMGLTVIPSSSHWFNLHLAAHLTARPHVHILYSPHRSQDSPYLGAIAPLGCTIEVGAVAQNVLDAGLFRQTESMIMAILDYIEAYNQGQITLSKQRLISYQTFDSLDYPRNRQGELLGMVHPQRQGQDYQPLNPGEPTFLTFDGHTLVYEGATTVYPVFINEAAYYEKQVAMSLTHRVPLELSAYGIK